MNDKEYIAENHRGVMFITNRLMKELDPDITTERMDTQGQLRDAGVFVRLRERLLLPESYTIVAVFRHSFCHKWSILIESPELPDSSQCNWEGSEYPHIEPRYCKVFNEQIGEYEPHPVDITVKAQRTIPVTGGVEWLVKALRADTVKQEKANNDQ